MPSPYTNPVRIALFVRCGMCAVALEQLAAAQTRYRDTPLERRTRRELRRAKHRYAEAVAALPGRMRRKAKKSA